MTKEAAKKFLEKIEKDAHFRESLQKAKGKGEVKKILEQNHLSFTKKEYTEAYQEKFHRHLNEDELKRIAAAGSHKISPSINFTLAFQDE